MKEGNIEETASWKGHSFTLLVFGGIVALCSIFFVLGMLVGRSQGQRIAEIAATETPEAKADGLASSPEITVLGADEGPGDIALKPLVPTPAEPRPEPPPSPPAAPAPTAKAATKTAAAKVPAPEKAAGKIYLQIAAVRQQKDAQRELQNVKSKGFTSALIVAPAPGDKAPFYRIQVGPYASDSEAEAAKRQLESKGFKQVLVKK
jgi:cell division septation protein DedD